MLFPALVVQYRLVFADKTYQMVGATLFEVWRNEPCSAERNEELGKRKPAAEEDCCLP